MIFSLYPPNEIIIFKFYKYKIGKATRKTLKRDLFNIRFKKVNNQINNPAQYNEIKKSIARLYTQIKNSK